MQDTVGGRITLLIIRNAYPQDTKEAHITVFLRGLAMLEIQSIFVNSKPLSRSCMIKVSFKSTPNRPDKEVQVFNKATIVTLQGETVFNGEMLLIPTKIYKWIVSNHIIVDNVPFSLDSIHIKAVGRAKKSDNDEDNPILAERIAEARAKIKVYKFMYTLCKKLYEYFCIRFMGFDDLRLAYWRVDSIYGDIKKYYKLLEKEKEHLQKLIEES